MITYWQLPSDKSYVRIDRNGLNTAIGEAILRSFYRGNLMDYNKPAEERDNFKDVERRTGMKLVKGTPPTGHFNIISPELEYFNLEGTNIWHPFNKRQSPHRFIPLATEENKGTVHALIRHPVQRFVSFINRYTPQLHTLVEGFDITKCVDDAILQLENTPKSEIFIYNNKQLIPQTTFLDNDLKGIRFYQYPNHTNELVADLGLSKQPQKAESTLLQSINLTTAHENIILDRFNADLELFDRIKAPGIILEV